jgi:hypothetical protein
LSSKQFCRVGLALARRSTIKKATAEMVCADPVTPDLRPTTDAADPTEGDGRAQCIRRADAATSELPAHANLGQVPWLGRRGEFAWHVWGSAIELPAQLRGVSERKGPNVSRRMPLR